MTDVGSQVPEAHGLIQRSRHERIIFGGHTQRHHFASVASKITQVPIVMERKVPQRLVPVVSATARNTHMHTYVYIFSFWLKSDSTY